jgi:hypothetical protein
MIVKRGDEWVLLTKAGGRVLGRHRSRAAAERQERAILAAKKKRREKYR